MKVLGVDPGPTRSGYAVVAWEIAGKPAYVTSGDVESTGPAAVALLELLEHDLLAVETCAGVFRGAAGIPLLETSFEGGVFAGIEYARGGAVEKVSSADWRRALTSKRGCSDAEIERVLRGHVQDMPAPRKTNAHERDAIGVACAALWRARMRRVASPPVSGSQPQFAAA